MTHLRLATFMLLTSMIGVACECGDRPASPAVAEHPQREALQGLPPPAPPSAADNNVKGVDGVDGVDGAVGGSGAAAASKARSSQPARGVGASVVRSFESLFDGDKLVITRNGARRISCDVACGLEASCTFRDEATCRAESCDGDVRTPSRMDYCLALDDSVTCLDAAACSCAESCWKRGECAKDHGNDDDCERSCRTLVNHDPTHRYVENRCVLEKACSEIATCGFVNAP